MRTIEVEPTEMRVLRSALALVLLSAAALSASAAPAGADAGYPRKPVRLIIGPAAGGPTDVVGRTFTPRLSEIWGQPVVVENRPGAANTIATARAAKANPDGYTLLLCPFSDAVAPAVFDDLEYNFVKDIVGVAKIGTMANVLVVHPSLGVTTLGEFVEYARKRPGELNYAAQGEAQAGHLGMSLFMRTAKIDLLYVPYSRSGLASADLLAGRVHAQITNLQAHLQNVRSGKLQALGVTTRTRDPRLPHVPAIAETFKSYEVTTWFGICAPAGLPEAVAAKVSADLRRALAAPDVAQKLADQGLNAEPSTPEAFTRFLKSEVAKWAEVVGAAGIRRNNSKKVVASN
jgi:tripartite-type tricarboxylate transporter receptor subunit TctC